MAGTFSSLYYHIVFSTHLREPLLPSLWQPRVHRYMAGIANTYHNALVRIGGMADHVHMLVRLKPDVAVAEFVRVVKANSSKWLNELDEYPGAFAWQRGYGAFSVSLSGIDQVAEYIDNQAKHHRAQSFQDEFRSFLLRHEIAFDERYIWD